LASLTVENYVKAIFKICLAESNQRATTGQIATAMNVSPGTVTSMLKTLSESGFVTYTPYEGVRLTPAGSELALKIIRRHRLIELFLTRTLGMGWDEVHDDAEQMEHAISDALIERIDRHLNSPQFDPHGDPIPTADGRLPTIDTQVLTECPPNTQFHLARVTDQSRDFLHYLSESGLRLGLEGRVVDRRIEAGVVTIEFEGREMTLGHEAAQKLQVTLGPAPVKPEMHRVIPEPHFVEQRVRVE
jgi:DtxR family Mn-dependent transcriptional regulator